MELAVGSHALNGCGYSGQLFVDDASQVLIVALITIDMADEDLELVWLANKSIVVGEYSNYRSDEFSPETHNNPFVVVSL